MDYEMYIRVGILPTVHSVSVAIGVLRGGGQWDSKIV